MSDNQAVMLDKALDFACENKYLALALDHLMADMVITHDSQFRSATIVLGGILLKRCEELTHMLQELEQAQRRQQNDSEKGKTLTVAVNRIENGPT